MTDTEATGSEPGRSTSSEASTRAHKEPRKKGGLGKFLREVIAELRKVVYPSRQELLTYTAVVLVFVIIVMIYVSALDFGIGRLIGWALGGGS